LFLVAGEYDDEGYLPPIEDIAIILRADEEHLETEMIELQRVGILSTDSGRWMVSKFADRQAAVSTAERMRQYRERKQKQQYYGDVTNRNVETESETDTESDKREGVARVATFYANNLTNITPFISEQIKGWVADYQEAWIMDAMKIAVTNNARNINYVSAILKRWQAEGKDDGAPRKNGRKPDNRQAEIDKTLEEVFGK